VSNFTQLAESIVLSGLDEFFLEILFLDPSKARERKSTRLVSHAIVLFPQEFTKYDMVFLFVWGQGWEKRVKILQGQHIDPQEFLNKSKGILHNCTPKINELKT
jgi:hypothetical protein